VLPDNPVRRFFFVANKHIYWEILVNICSVCNVLVVALNYDDTTPFYAQVVVNINYTFSFFVVFELVVKLFAFKMSNYFDLFWNNFNLFTAGLFLLDFTLFNLVPTYTGAYRIIPKVVRMCRIIKLFKVISRF
jgi:hypothetical protein